MRGYGAGKWVGKCMDMRGGWGGWMDEGGGGVITLSVQIWDVCCNGGQWLNWAATLLTHLCLPDHPPRHPTLASLCIHAKQEIF